MKDARFPYTYAADFLRSLGPVNGSGVVLSRSDASQIREGIAKALHMDDGDLATVLANYYLEHQGEIDEAAVNHLSVALGLLPASEGTPS